MIVEPGRAGVHRRQNSAGVPLKCGDVSQDLLWVCFGTGAIEKIDGVTVLDIRDAVRGVLSFLERGFVHALGQAGAHQPVVAALAGARR